MREIQLTHGKVALVDDEDYNWLNQYKWHATPITKDNRTSYARASIRISGELKHVRMHRLILGLIDPKIDTDHGDRNTLNNQRYNIKACTKSQNCCNKSKIRLGCTSVYKGVHRSKKYGFWIARVMDKNTKRLYIGSFKNEIDAAKAYDQKALVLHGEFASLNFKQI